MSGKQSGESAVEVARLHKGYGDAVAVDDGPNGAGKTTTVECVLGLLGDTAL